MDISLNKLNETLNQVKTEATQKVAKITHKLEQTKKSKDWYQNELIACQNQSSEVIKKNEEKCRQMEERIQTTINRFQVKQN